MKGYRYDAIDYECHLQLKIFNSFTPVKIYWITNCTTTGYLLPLFSPRLKKREDKKENEVAKPVLKDQIDFLKLLILTNQRGDFSISKQVSITA